MTFIHCLHPDAKTTKDGHAEQMVGDSAASIIRGEPNALGRIYIDGVNHKRNQDIVLDFNQLFHGFLETLCRKEMKN